VDAYEDGTDKEIRNVGYQEPDAGESPKKKNSLQLIHGENLKTRMLEQLL